MDLPPLLKQAVERELEGVPLADLRHATERLSYRYRAEIRDGHRHLDGELAVKAYLAARLPATYAAIRASMAALSETLPDFQPQSLLDIGAGPGTALWAATDCWPRLESAALVEASGPAQRAGARLMSNALKTEWISGDVVSSFPTVQAADLVTIAYVLDELAPAAIGSLVKRLWDLTMGVLLVVEPGTPAGWNRILAVRGQLLVLGAHLAAPCPHEVPCPLVLPDWCHFSQRVPRSRLHRLAKSGDVPWEDEKFIYLAASRAPIPTRDPRVLAPPRTASGRITLKLCNADGTAGDRTVSRRDGTIYKQARRLAWGDSWTVSKDSTF